MLKGKGGEKKKEPIKQPTKQPTNFSEIRNQPPASPAREPSKSHSIKHEQFPIQNGKGSSQFPINHSDNNELSLRDYWETILRYRGIVVIIFIVCILSSGIMAFVLPKNYSATAKLISKSSGGSSNPLAAMSGMSEEEGFDIFTILEIAKTNDIFKEAFEQLEKNFKPFISTDLPISKKEKGVYENFTQGRLQSSVKIKLDSTSENIIIVTSLLEYSPNIAAAVANSFCDALMLHIKKLKHLDSYRQLQTFENLIAQNNQELIEIDENIKLLSQIDPQNISLTSRETLVFKKLTATETKLQTALLGLREIEEQIRTIKIDFGIEKLPLAKVKFVDLSEGMQRRLQDLIYQREELLTRYKPENPSVKKLDNQIKSLKETLRPKNEGEDLHYVKVDRFKIGMVSTLLNLNSKKEATQNRLKYLDEEIKSLNKDLIEVPEELKELRKLSTKKEVLFHLQTDLQRQVQNEKVIMLSMNSGLDFLEKAIPNLSASTGSFKKYILGGILLGLVFGVSVAFILNNWENTIKSSSDLKRHFQYPSLGVIPQWNSDVKYIDENIPDSNIAEVYGMLRNNVRFCGIESPEKGLLIASASQTEGKSLTAVNLSLSFALEGNSTILISADLRRAYSHTQFKNKDDLKKKVGIVEYLEGTAPIEDVIYKSTFSNFSFIPTCARANNPTKLLKTDNFDRLLSYAERNFDTVIIDSPAILPVVDATIFSSKVRGVLIVAHASQTPITAIQETINRLEHVGSPIIGIALNRIKDLKLEYFYGYGISNYASYKTYS